MTGHDDTGVPTKLVAVIRKRLGQNKQVRRKLSPERGEAQLIDLGYDCDVRRTDYDNNEEYAAAVMGVDAAWLAENFG